MCSMKHGEPKLPENQPQTAKDFNLAEQSREWRFSRDMCGTISNSLSYYCFPRLCRDFFLWCPAKLEAFLEKLGDLGNEWESE